MQLDAQAQLVAVFHLAGHQYLTDRADARWRACMGGDFQVPELGSHALGLAGPVVDEADAGIVCIQLQCAARLDIFVQKDRPAKGQDPVGKVVGHGIGVDRRKMCIPAAIAQRGGDVRRVEADPEAIGKAADMQAVMLNRVAGALLHGDPVADLGAQAEAGENPVRRIQRQNEDDAPDRPKQS